MRSKKGMSASALVVVALFAVFGLATGQISVDDLAGELLGNSSSSSSSNASSEGSSNVASSPAPGSSQVGGAPELTVAEAREALSGLEISASGSMAGYSREDFDHWENAADYGWSIPSYVEDPGSCDVRDATLIRDGSNVEVGEYCEVGSGEWADPYTGKTLTDPADLDGEHVVPLANAFRSGAASWSEAKKAEYANDPTVVAATDDGENQSKGDKGPEAWQPPYEGSHCSYAARWVQIKDEWALSITSSEKAALSEMLAGCGS